MMDFIQLLFILVVVTQLPIADSQQLRPLLPGSSRTSKIIRFLGNSFIRYDLNVLTAESLAPADKESFTLQFITQDDEGLIWLFEGTRNNKLHLSLKDGKLLFVIDDGVSLPQQVILQSQSGRPLNDFLWHPVKIEKEGRLLKFYIDDQYITQLTAQSDVQFVAPGQVYLGGSPQVSTVTGGLITSNIDGAITNVTSSKFIRPKREISLYFLQFVPSGQKGVFEIIDGDDGAWTTSPPPTTSQVESGKFTRPKRELILSFLSFVATAKEGEIYVIDPDEWNKGNGIWITPTPPTRPPELPTPVTFTSGGTVFYLSEPLDLRSGGSFSFRFRTLTPRGLLAIARGSPQSVNFMAVEIFDGILYFVYDFGTFSSRKQFSDQRMDDGEWHEVKMEIKDNRMLLSLDDIIFPTSLPASEILKLYFHRFYIGGYNFEQAPWPLYSRTGYRGCIESLKVNNIGVDLHRRFRDANVRNVEIGCRSSPRLCPTQPCVSGVCRDTMSGYVCDCSKTPFTGQNCDSNAVIGSWDGTTSTNLEFLNREVTHTNDLSFRFMTPLRDTLLFKTEVDENIGSDYIQAELENGRVKVTMNVGGQRKTFYTGNNLNDYFWHTVYIRRRADDVEVWVDDEPKRVDIIGGENYNLKIDRIRFGSLGATGTQSTNNYIGYLQNFIYDGRELLGQLRKRNTNVIWFDTYEDLPLLTYKPVTITSSDTFFQLPSLNIGRTLKILFKFKTRESNGIILYNTGVGNDVLAIELSNGELRLAYNLGGRNMARRVPTPYKLNDNRWHTVQIALNELGQFTAKVDSTPVHVTTSDGDGRLDLTGALYIAGLPEQMFRDSRVTNLIKSRKGFRGCLASMDLDGAVPDLPNHAHDKQYIVDGCTELSMACLDTDVCGPGTCMPGIGDDYWCDCNMTGYAGTPCQDLPIGYYFGKNSGKGIVIYEFPQSHIIDSNVDNIAFGFKTRERQGTLYRLESSLGGEYIEIRLEDGFIIAESKTGKELAVLAEKGRIFSDGNYHVVRFIRTGSNITLRVDNLPAQSTYLSSGTGIVFDKVYRVLLGGRQDAAGKVTDSFYGIMGGAYWNGYRWIDALHNKEAIHGNRVNGRGDVEHSGAWLLVAGGRPTTPAPPDIFIPPIDSIPPVQGGGGVVEGIHGAGGTGVGGPPLIGGPGGTFPGGASLYVPGEPVPLASALVGAAAPPLATGTRAGAVVGTVLGTLAFLTSLMWGLYKMKPGVPSFLSPGAASAAGGPVSITAPRATSNLAAVQAAGGAGGGGAGGAGATKLTVVNGAASGGAGGAGAGGGGSTTYTSFYQSTSTAVSGGGAGAGAGDAVDSSTLRATGTFSNKGTALGTPKAGRANMESTSSAYNYQSATMSGYGGGEGGGLGSSSYDRQYISSSSSHGGLPDYDLPVGSGTLQSGYSTSTLNTHYNYQAVESRYSTGGKRNVEIHMNQPKQYTSALTVLISDPSSAHVRFEPYIPSSHSSASHEFIDRAEDIIITTPNPSLLVKSNDESVPRKFIEERNTEMDHEYVTLHASDSSAFATYKSSTSLQSEHILTDKSTAKAATLGRAKLRNGNKPKVVSIFDPSRKASLQITPQSKSRPDGYERLESYTSETSINVSTSDLKRTPFGSGSRSCESEDNLYESTATVTSTVRSDSIENTLISLEEESTNTVPGSLDLLMQTIEDFNTSVAFSENGSKVQPSAVGTNSEYASINKPRTDTAKANFDSQEMHTLSSISDIKSDSSVVELKTEQDHMVTTSFSFPSMRSEGMIDEVMIDIEDRKKEDGKHYLINSNERSEITELSEGEKTFAAPKPQSSLSKERHVTVVVDKDLPSTSTKQIDELNIQHDNRLTTGSTPKQQSGLNEFEFDYDRALNEHMEGMMLGMNMDPSKWFDLDKSADIASPPPEEWKVQNLKTVTLNRQGQYVLTGAGMAGAVTPGAAADEVRVDCCLMTNDGRNVVTGSSLGPPQVWDMANGELLRIMKGDTIGSTDLHLVCGDRLLVGAVHADMEINEYSGRKGVFNHTLQIWDFVTGKPLSMAEGEYCSALCPMSDSDKVLFGRTDKFGDATNIIAWDLMGNQMIKKMRYDAPVGNNDYINYLALSKNDRYVVAGFTNSFDNFAEFLVFDMILTSHDISEPAMLKLDANPDCTAILPKDEAVTGLRNGDLVIWSIRTGQPSRQLLGSGGAHAHSREVKSVTLSDDGKYLVSASADGTLKVWDMHTERPIHTLTGHADEVWCSSISPDNEIVVSGSNDGTIRLWRMKNGTEMCVFNCGVDIFFVTMSHDKGTIVALGDKYGARKLIMLQVVRTKIKKIVSS